MPSSFTKSKANRANASNIARKKILHDLLNVHDGNWVRHWPVMDEDPKTLGFTVQIYYGSDWQEGESHSSEF